MALGDARALPPVILSELTQAVFLPYPASTPWFRLIKWRSPRRLSRAPRHPCLESLPPEKLSNTLADFFQRPERTIPISALEDVSVDPDPVTFPEEVQIMMKRFAFLFICCLSFCVLFMAATDVQAEYVTYNADDINPAYRWAFGRDAKPDEFAYWSRNDIRNKFKKDACSGVTGFAANKLEHSDCMKQSRSDARIMLAQQIKSYLRTPEGAPELKATIDRSYKAAFNRLPNPQEFAYWQTECKTKNMGYHDLIVAHKKWEQTGVKSDERLAMIKSVYTGVYGRDPDRKEIDYWMAVIPKEGIIYEELCNNLKNWISGNSSEQIHELENVIRRAYAKASVTGPNAEQMKLAMNYVTSTRPFFSQLVDWVKKEGAAKLPAGAMPVKVPSFKR